MKDTNSLFKIQPHCCIEENYRRIKAIYRRTKATYLRIKENCSRTEEIYRRI